MPPISKFLVSSLCLALAGCSSLSLPWPAAAPEVAAAQAPSAPLVPEIPAKPPVAGLLAGALGAELSVADRQTAFDAELAALDTGQRKSWRGKRGVFGSVEPEAEIGGCRAYVETIYVAGRPKQGHGHGCQQPDGAWRITG